jgi:Kef-type K+ transport system membrane component KefB
MHTLVELLDFVSPSDASRAAAKPPESRAGRLLLAVTAFLAALVCAGLWGLAAGSGSGRVAVGNLFEVPMLLVVSSLAALPAGLLAFRLTARGGRSTDLLVAHASAIFAGSLVLALLAPIVALYQHSSAFAGPIVAFATAVIGVGVACAVLLRTLGKLVAREKRRAFWPAVSLLLVLQLAALAQVASITAPVFPHRTAFGRGVDGLSAQDAP